MKNKLTKLIGIAALGLAMVALTPTVLADPPSSFDFPIASALNGSASTNGTATATGTAVGVPANADLILTVTVTCPTAVIMRSNAVVGLNTIWGPTAGQRTTTQPISCTVPLAVSNVNTLTFFVSRTNFNGCAGMAVDSFGINDSTNGAFILLSEVSGNWAR